MQYLENSWYLMFLKMFFIHLPRVTVSKNKFLDNDADNDANKLYDVLHNKKIAYL